MYKKLHVHLSESIVSNGNRNGIENGASERQLPPFDKSWLETSSRASMARFEKLDADLRSYKSNSIKESIRRGHNDLGKHFLNIGW